MRRLPLTCLLVLLGLASLGPRCAAEARWEHVLNRVAYGPDPWSRARIQELGVYNFIDEQLAPETIDDSAFEVKLAGFPSLAMSYTELRASYCSMCALGGAGVPRSELRKAKLLRSIYSRRQLEAVLTDFWFDHFNVDARSGYARWDVVPYEREAIRPHVLGRFEDMLLATARSPAMLDYLDNRINFKEGFVNANGELKGLNENYARELMELHTLGVDGGYDQADVIEVARIMTGWSTNADGFKYKNFIHDQGPKQVMGELVIPANGKMQDGLDLIAFLADHPTTAARLSRLLVQRFVSEDPPPALVQDAASVYLSTGGDLREVMRTILHSREFTEGSYRNKVKRPLVVLASAARALRAQSAEAELNRFVTELRSMGEPLYEAAPPTGFPEASAFWAGTGAILARMNAMRWMAHDPDLGTDLGLAGGTSVEIVDALLPRLVFGHVSPFTRNQLLFYLDGIPGASGPARVGDAAALILSSPEFLRH
ncbi:MAG: DUF1800 domain-containing protein [Myxococcota bacterium]|nr:DUF1800 domain-containing protein [Myxococcota bacterium]